MSLHTIVQDGFALRLHRPDASARRSAPRATALTGAVRSRISISSMRILETGIAVSALATALLIGQGR